MVITPKNEENGKKSPVLAAIERILRNDYDGLGEDASTVEKDAMRYYMYSVLTSGILPVDLILAEMGCSLEEYVAGCLARHAPLGYAAATATCGQLYPGQRERIPSHTAPIVEIYRECGKTYVASVLSTIEVPSDMPVESVLQLAYNLLRDVYDYAGLADFEVYDAKLFVGASIANIPKCCACIQSGDARWIVAGGIITGVAELDPAIDIDGTILVYPISPVFCIEHAMPDEATIKSLTTLGIKVDGEVEAHVGVLLK